MIKIVAIVSLVLAIITSGCGFAIHKKWVGEIEPTPHIVLGAIVILGNITFLILVINS